MTTVRPKRSEAAPTSLTARRITVRFVGLTALEDVDVSVRRGEILGLIGPNGAGKTTLVNVLTGFQRPTSGTVELNGVDITGWSPRRHATAGLARTFQGARVFAELTAVENV